VAVNEQDVTVALDSAVPPMPESLRDAPLPAIRARVRRRRVLTRLAVVLAVLLATVPAWLVARQIGARGQAVPPGTTSPTASAAATWPAGWTMAMVDASGRHLQVGIRMVRSGSRVGAGADCQRVAGATVRESAGQVVITVRATWTGPTCGWRDQVGEVTLDRPLSNRALLDGYTHESPPAIWRTDLPVPTYPAGLRLDADWPDPDGVAWMVGYTGSTRVDITAFPAADVRDSGTRIKEATVAGHAITIYAQTTTYLARWSAHGTQFSLSATPNGNARATLAAFEAVLAGLRWPP
jgi:hypothetical protein